MEESKPVQEAKQRGTVAMARGWIGEDFGYTGK